MPISVHFNCVIIIILTAEMILLFDKHYALSLEPKLFFFLLLLYGFHELVFSIDTQNAHDDEFVILRFVYVLFIFLPSPCVKNVTVTLMLSSKASVSNGCSMGADFVKTTRFGMICPSITFLSISSGRGCG